MSELSERILAHCQDDADCLLWQGGVSLNGMPIMRHAGSNKAMVRRVLYEELHGPIPPGNVVAVTCGHKRCLQDDHLKAVTRGEARTIAAGYGAYRHPARRRKATATVRARSQIQEETVEKIRGASSAKDAHAQTGVSLPYCYAIRAGVARAPLTTPFAGLGRR